MKVSKPFVFTHVYLNSTCNLKCGYCDLWKHPKPDLSLAKWRYILNTLNPLTHSWNFIGTEPLLYPWIEGLVEFLEEEDFNYVLSTNGLEKKKLERLLDAGLRSVALSCDTLQPHLLRGLDSYSRCKSGVCLELVDMLEEYSNVQKLVGVTVQRANLDEVPEIASFFLKRGWYVCLNPIQVPAEGKMLCASVPEAAFCEEDSPRLKAMLQGVIAGRPESRTVDLNVVDDAVYAMWPEHAVEQKWNCRQMGMIAVDSQGSLGCCFLFAGRKVPLHKIGELDLVQLAEDYQEDVRDCPGCFWNSNVIATLVREGKIELESII